MKQMFLHQAGTSCLTVFFAGWGMDKTPFQAYCFKQDVLLCYDYSDLNFDTSLLAGYERLRVVAWSMGVWVAAWMMLQHPEWPVRKRVAVNGTLFPVDALRGIPPAVFSGTLSGLSASTLVKFRRRMCGTASAYADFEKLAPRRELESLRDELYQLEGFYRAASKNGFGLWDEVYVGTSDLIFPTANQMRAWSEGLVVHLRSFEGAHYNASLLEQLLCKKHG